MSRYHIRNLNWRDGTTEWTWHTKYLEWLAIAEQLRPSHQEKPLGTPKRPMD
jgi:hypothetical protein